MKDNESCAQDGAQDCAPPLRPPRTALASWSKERSASRNICISAGWTPGMENGTDFPDAGMRWCDSHPIETADVKNRWIYHPGCSIPAWLDAVQQLFSSCSAAVQPETWSQDVTSRILSLHSWEEKGKAEITGALDPCRSTLSQIMSWFLSWSCLNWVSGTGTVSNYIFGRLPELAERPRHKRHKFKPYFKQLSINTCRSTTRDDSRNSIQNYRHFFKMRLPGFLAKRPHRLSSCSLFSSQVPVCFSMASFFNPQGADIFPFFLLTEDASKIQILWSFYHLLQHRPKRGIISWVVAVVVDIIHWNSCFIIHTTIIFHQVFGQISLDDSRW